MYIINLKKTQTIATDDNSSSLYLASIDAMMKEPETEISHDEIYFDEENNLIVPGTYTITEDSTFLVNEILKTVWIVAPYSNDDDTDEGPCLCECGSKSNRHYYATISSLEPVESITEPFVIETLVMRTEPIAPQFIIGYARNGQYIIEISREDFEGLAVGDTIELDMEEFYESVTGSINEAGFDDEVSEVGGKNDEG